MSRPLGRTQWPCGERTTHPAAPEHTAARGRGGRTHGAGWHLGRRADRRGVLPQAPSRRRQRGEILRLSRDRYALPGGERAREIAQRVDGCLGLVSAALHWGWEVCVLPECHQVVVPPGFEPPADLPPAELVEHDLSRRDVDGWATTRLITVLMCAARLSFRDALAIADSALRHGDLAQDDLLRAAQHWPAHQRDHVLHVVQYADGRAANPLESALRAIAIEEGLAVVAQHEIRAGALVVHPDVVDPIRGIVLEAESVGFHTDGPTLARDCVRYSLLTATGWRVLRFTWSQVFESEPYVRSVIRMLLAELAAGGATDGGGSTRHAG